MAPSHPRPAVLAVLVVLLAALTVAGGDAQSATWDNGLARTPPMGFNDWNATQCTPAFDEAMVEQTANVLLSSGLAAAGYRYVNLDDCWALPNRDAAGQLVPDPRRFPHGISGIADYLHRRGLLLGIYSSAGTFTCAANGFPGGLGHEGSDARQFAQWGVDYLKYDNCHNNNVDARERYSVMRDALAATHRPIVYSICEWGESAPWQWASQVGNSWRTTQDVADNWSSVLANFQGNVGLSRFAEPGHWNDPDMLEVGNGGLTRAEQRSQFTLWAMMAAPLLIGTDLRQADPDTLALLGNRDVIALDQDPLGRQAVQVSADGPAHVLVKPLANGDRAVALFNAGDASVPIRTDLGLPDGPHPFRELWSGTTGVVSGPIAATVPAHTAVVYRITG